MADLSPTLLDPAVWRRVEYYSRITRVVRFVREHVRRPISLAEAAELACMERTAFSRYFKHRVGVTFSRFLRAYRVEVAVDVMTREDLSLQEVADRAGFGSLATMERCFKLEMGESPSSYRRRLLVADRVLEPPTGEGQPLHL